MGRCPVLLELFTIFKLFLIDKIYLIRGSFSVSVKISYLFLWWKSIQQRDSLKSPLNIHFFMKLGISFSKNLKISIAPVLYRLMTFPFRKTCICLINKQVLGSPTDYHFSNNLYLYLFWKRRSAWAWSIFQCTGCLELIYEFSQIWPNNIGFTGSLLLNIRLLDENFFQSLQISKLYQIFRRNYEPWSRLTINKM